jgi:hypothetical protein
MLISIDATKYDWQIELSRNFCQLRQHLPTSFSWPSFPRKLSTTVENIFRMGKAVSGHQVDILIRVPEMLLDRTPHRRAE